MTVDAYFFDFDGVILESVSVKSEAFFDLFEEHGRLVQEQVLAYHLANLGVSRFDKFDHIYRHILGRPLTPDMMDALCKRFAALVVERVLAAPFVAGAHEFLSSLERGKSFLVSATPQTEIEYIVSCRNLSPFFVSVHGSPVTKDEWVRQLLRDHGIDRCRAVFFGDALSDWEAARSNGIHFVGRVASHGPSPLRDLPCAALVRDLRGVERALQEIDGRPPTAGSRNSVPFRA